MESLSNELKQGWLWVIRYLVQESSKRAVLHHISEQADPGWETNPKGGSKDLIFLTLFMYIYYIWYIWFIYLDIFYVIYIYYLDIFYVLYDIYYINIIYICYDF